MLVRALSLNNDKMFSQLCPNMLLVRLGAEMQLGQYLTSKAEFSYASPLVIIPYHDLQSRLGQMGVGVGVG